jgi:hypothetical protein
VSTTATVIEALRRFLPAFLKTAPLLSNEQRRAIWALIHCRTAAMGGAAFQCQRCGQTHFAFHSCNHKACPQCGRQATQRWVQRELAKRVNAPYFLVTFTLPSELRSCFFGPQAKEFYDLFFAAVSGALTEKLATAKGLRAQVSGFTAALHTWNQRLEFHPHIHCLVPGAGLKAKGKPVRVKQANFLVYLPLLQAAFRQHMRRLMTAGDWQADPKIWRLDWGVHIQPAGSGSSAIKYLGAYVARTAITDRRILELGETSVTFRWKDRSENNRPRQLTLPGTEFVRRYLRHVLPAKLRAIRSYGFCHPSAKANRMRVQFHSGMPVPFGAIAPVVMSKACPPCPKCGGSTQFVGHIAAPWRKRGPPALKQSARDGRPPVSTPIAA